VKYTTEVVNERAEFVRKKEYKIIRYDAEIGAFIWHSLSLAAAQRLSSAARRMALIDRNSVRDLLHRKIVTIPAGRLEWVLGGGTESVRASTARSTTLKEPRERMAVDVLCSGP
jgi:hypothetical protein